MQSPSVTLLVKRAKQIFEVLKTQTSHDGGLQPPQEGWCVQASLPQEGSRLVGHAGQDVTLTLED